MGIKVWGLLVFAVFLVYPLVAQYQITEFIKEAGSPKNLEFFEKPYLNELSQFPVDSIDLFTKEIVEFARRSSDQKLELAVRRFHALFLMNKPEYLDVGIEKFEKLISFTERNYREESIQLKHDLGYAIFTKKHDQQGLSTLLAADYAMKSIGYEHFQKAGISLFRTATVFLEFRNFNKAKEYTYKCMEFTDSSGVLVFGTLNMLGILHSELYNADSSLYFFQKAYDQAERTNDLVSVGAALSNLGILHLDQENDSLAYSYLQKALVINSKNNKHNYLIAAMFELIRYHTRRKEFTKAHKYAADAYKLMTQNNVRNFSAWSTYYEKMYHMFRGEGKLELACLYGDSLRNHEDSVQKILDNEMLANLTFQLEAERHIADIRILENDKKLQSTQIKLLSQEKRFTKLVRNTIVIAAICVILLLLWIWRLTLLQRKRQIQILQNQKKEDEEQLKSFKKRIVEKNKLLEALKSKIKDLETGSNKEEHHGLFEQLDQSTILTEDDWLEFKRLFTRVYPEFLSKISASYPDLTTSEIRLLVLTKLNFDVHEMASTLGILPESVRKTRLRAIRKLGISDHKKLYSLVDKL